MFEVAHYLFIRSVLLLARNFLHNKIWGLGAGIFDERSRHGRLHLWFHLFSLANQWNYCLCLPFLL
jgi:hypothetical protein